MMRGLQNCAIKEPEPFAQFSLCRTQWQKLSARFAGMEIKDRAAVQNIYSLTLLSGDDVGIDHVEAASYGLKMSTMRKRNLFVPEYEKRDQHLDRTADESLGATTSKD